jgi:hypothetical protein
VPAIIRDAEIRGRVLIHQSEFKSINLAHSHIGDLSILGIESNREGNQKSVAPAILLIGVLIDDSLYIQNAALRLDLDSAKVVKGVEFDNCTLLEGSSARNLEVGIDVSFRAEIHGPVDLSFAKIGSSLNLSTAKFKNDVDLTGAAISGSIVLSGKDFSEGESNCAWGRGAMLKLRDTSANLIQDSTDDAWPKTMQLDGFYYKKWRVSQTNPNALQQDLDHREIGWFLRWLKGQTIYTPGPYRQLATLFRDEGWDAKATAVLFAGKERERHESGYPAKVFLFLSKIFIGYGYHYEFSIYWCIGIVLLGTLVLKFSREGWRQKVDVGFFYSLDAFLPFVQLRRAFDGVDFQGWVKYYFYIHRLAGYVIGSFILAGLSGITK